MNKTNSKVDQFLNKTKKWREEMDVLRAIMLDCGLNEELKWGKPCYMFDNTNLFILQGFKEFCALLFTNGALLNDAHNILEKPGENTQAARRIPFTGVKQIMEKEGVLKSYIYEAIEVEKAELKVTFADKTSLVFPEEFQIKLDENPALKSAFETLTPGRQRVYNMYFSAPKQSKTRISRVEQCIPKILDGKGINDR